MVYCDLECFPLDRLTSLTVNGLSLKVHIKISPDDSTSMNPDGRRAALQLSRDDSCDNRELRATLLLSDPKLTRQLARV
jgi:hypothetical protein